MSAARIQQWGVPAGLLLLNLAVFGHVVICGWVNLDDPLYVTHNRNVVGGLTAENIEWAIGSGGCWWSMHWMPLTWLSLQADASLFGPTAYWGFHLTNLVLHCCAVVLWYWALQRMTGQIWLSALAAALFGCHPLRVESVAWLTERKDVLSGLFVALTVAAYHRYTLAPSLGRYVLVFLALLGGVLSKPSVVTLPCALLLLDYWPLRRLRVGDSSETARPWWFLALEKTPLLAVSAVISVETMYYSEHIIESSWLERLAVGVSGYLSYVEKTLWPIGLACFYPLETPAPARLVVAGFVLTIITAGALALATRAPALLVGWLWFLGTLVPNSGIVQAGLQGYADRFTYIPHMGLAVALVWGAYALLEAVKCPRWLSAGIGAVLILVLAGLSWQQVWHWRDSQTLFQHCASVTGHSYYTRLGLGVHAFGTGDYESARAHLAEATELARDQNAIRVIYGDALLASGRPKDAYVELTRAKASGSSIAGLHAAGATENNPSLHYLLAQTLADLGRWKSARQALRRSLECWTPGMADNLLVAHYLPGGTNQRHSETYRLLGELDLRDGNNVQAIEHLDRAIELLPQSAQAYQVKGVALLRLGQWSEAETCLQKAIELDRSRPSPRGYLGLVLTRQKRSAAAQQYVELVRQCPDWPYRTYAQTLKCLTQSRFIDHATALELAEQVTAATDFKDPDALDVLAATFAATGNFAKAEQTVQAALALQPPRATADRLRERLQLYQAKRALPVEPSKE